MKAPPKRTDNSRAITMALRFFPDTTPRLIPEGNRALMLNAGAFTNPALQAIRNNIRRAFEEAETIAKDSGRKLVPTIDFRAFANDFSQQLSEGHLEDGTIQHLLNIVGAYRGQWKTAGGKETWRDGPQFPEYDVRHHSALLRYGNVELRVIQDYLLSSENLRTLTERVAQKWGSEPEMYALNAASGVLAHDDPDWNIRRLMTNAGFYVGSDPNRAWDCLEDWVSRYISAICNSHLVWANTKALFFPRIQRSLYKTRAFVPRYVQLPSVRRIYETMKDKDVLFVSPMAHIVNEQAASGHIWRLYKDYDVPSFSVRAVPAWISTWPHRPHSDWSETFSAMCESVQTAYRERPFQYFVAACGCYGLPLADFVRTEFACPTLYIGHQAHKLFGILPASSARINREMWVESDLGRYENMDRIDKGRYLNVGR